MTDASHEIASAKLIAATAIEERTDDLIRLAKDIWNHPEPGFREHRTAKKTAEFMRATGLEPREGVAITGVVARLDTGRPGPHIAIMGELDSLIVPEHRLAEGDLRLSALHFAAVFALHALQVDVEVKLSHA